METLKCSPDALVSLESVLTTAELSRRPSRPPDYQAENQALVALAQELANSPSSMLVDTALELCRIAETDLPKIFQPFFTSKKRNGLRAPHLSTDRQETRGKIEVESQPGKGTTFKVYFPLSREADKKCRAFLDFPGTYVRSVIG